MITPIWGWHIYLGLHLIQAQSGKFAIGSKQCYCPCMADITGLQADSGWTRVKGGLITPYSFVTFLSYFILNKNRHNPTTTIAWVVNINRTREGLRSLSLSLAEKHGMTGERGVMLLVSDLSFEKQEFMELSLERFFVNIGGYPSTSVVLFVARIFI